MLCFFSVEYGVFTFVTCLVLFLSIVALSFYALWQSANKRTGILSILAQGYVMLHVVTYVTVLIYFAILSIY